MEPNFEVPSNRPRNVIILVLDLAAHFETLGSKTILPWLLHTLQILSDTDGVVSNIVGTEASHVVFGWLWSPVELERNEEDVQEVQAEKNTADWKDLGPHQWVNFWNIIY